MTYFVYRCFFIIFFFTAIQSHYAHAQMWQYDTTSLKSYVNGNNNENPVIVYFDKSFFKLSKSWKIISLYAKDMALVQANGQAQNYAGIRAWRPLDFMDKLPADIAAVAQVDNGNLKVFVKTLPAITAADVVNKLMPFQANAQVYTAWAKHNFYPITIPANQLLALAHQPWVLGIVADPPIELANDAALSMTHARAVTYPLSIGGKGYTGKGVVLSIGDDGNATHIDNADRMLYQYNPTLSSGHAVHVMTTAAGAGIKDETKKGFAYGADLVSVYFSANLAYLDALVNTHQVTITNNSYGTRLSDCSYLGLYDGLSQSIDELSLAYPYTLHVFSAGNSGSVNCIPAYPRYGNVGGGYQPAKNTLSVGNFGKQMHWVHPNSSKGPLKDGRLKPEIGAIGLYVNSGGNNNSYFIQSGTSMSGPNVAGAAAILSEAYRAHYDTLPLAAVLKAVLMNGANDVATPGPDYWYGFGLLDVQQSLSIIEQGNIVVDTIIDAALHTHTVTVPPGTKRAKFMIYWHDPAAMPSLSEPAQNKLINDLDLQVVKPDASILQPWVLNPYIPTAAAIRGIDTLNNVEQVTIDNPATGEYSIRVQGSSVIDAQQYVVVWQFEKDELSMLYPLGAEAVAHADTLRIYFKAPATTNTFTVQLSLDAGATWTTLNSAIPDSVRHYFHYLPNTITTHQARVRVLENTTSKAASSANFTIAGRNIVEVSSSEAQCPGSIRIQWTPVSGASHYVTFRNIAGEMRIIDTLPSSQLFYTFTGLDPQLSHWVTVAPLIGGTIGMRAIAVESKPNYGDCSNPDLPLVDVAIKELTAPKNGRQFTSTALSDETIIQVQVQNRSATTIHSYNLGYVVNGGAARIQHFETPIAAGATVTLAFTSHPFDFSAPGDYTLSIFNATADANTLNDTISTILRHLPNAPIDVDMTYVEDFEATIPFAYNYTVSGLWGADKWDYEKSAGWGRLQTYINQGVSIQGKHSLSMDLTENARHDVDAQSLNAAIVTLNLGAYDLHEKEIRADFIYRFSGKPKYLAEQSIWIRGQDTDPWIMVKTLDTADAGTLKFSGYLSLNDVLMANGQEFSQSTQLKIAQKDTSLIAGPDFGNGLTIDSFRLYAVSNDVSIESIQSPVMYGCNFSNAHTVTVNIRNNVLYTLYDVEVFYQLDGGVVSAGVLDSIPAKSSIDYTFSTPVDLSAKGKYSLKAWVVSEEDEYANNDTIRDYEIYHMESIGAYPYYQGFENVDDTILSNTNSAWTFDTPNLRSIRDAANGKGAAVTNLLSNEHAEKFSYLYVPCMDLTTLDNPYISFSLSFFFEAIDTTAPHHIYVEYTKNGLTWDKLGTHTSGYNWYNDNRDFWVGAYRDWIGVSHPLPKDAKGLRIVFVGYPGSRNAGAAIDDLHIYDFDDKIFETDGALNATIDIAEGVATSAIVDTAILATVNSASALSSTTIHQYNPANVIVTDMNEGILPTNYSMVPTNTGVSNKEITFFLPYNSFDKLVNSDCVDCRVPSSIYRLGITNYMGAFAQINGQLSDNTDGVYTFIPRDEIAYIPYGNGYKVDFKHSGHGEYWFSNGGYNGQGTLVERPIVFDAVQVNPVMTKATWISSIDTMVSNYYLQTLISGGIFLDIYEQGSKALPEASYLQLDTPDVIDHQVTYRLKYVLKNGDIHYSLPITLYWNGDTKFSVYPNPVTNGTLNIAWDLQVMHPIQLQIYSTDGRQVYTHRFEPAALRGTYLLEDIGHLSAGVYFIKILAGREFATIKIVIE